MCGGYNDCEDCSGKLNGGMVSESGKTIAILINPCQPNFFTCLLTMNSMSGFSVTKFSKLG